MGLSYSLFCLFSFSFCLFLGVTMRRSVKLARYRLILVATPVPVHPSILRCTTGATPVRIRGQPQGTVPRD